MSVSTHSTSATTSQIVESRGSRLCLEKRDERHPGKLSLSLFTVIAAIFVAARFWRLTSYGLFGDEVFTLWTAAQDWRSLLESVVGDVVHPPLFYMLLKVWIGVGGQSLLWLKLLPALLSIASVIPFFALCRDLRLEPAAMNLALWLMAINGLLITHAQELRMYSLLFLLTLTSLWLFAKLINQDAGSRKTQTMLCAVNLLMVFTHYYGWVIIALELMFLSIWKRERLRLFAFAAAFLALCFSPWVWFVAKAARVNPSRVNFVWNRPPPASELVGYYGNLNGPLSYRWKVFGTALVMLAFLAPVAVWGWRLRRGRENKPYAMAFWWLALFAFAPVALAFVASHLLPQSVWAFRYLIIAAPAYLLIVAAAAYSLNTRPVRIGAVGLMVCWSALSGFTEMTARRQIAWEPLVLSMIQAEPGQGPVEVYVTDSNIGNTIQFYLDQASETRFQISFADSLSGIEADHYWVAVVTYEHETEPLIPSALRERGYDAGEMIESEAAGQRAMMVPVWKRH